MRNLLHRRGAAMASRMRWRLLVAALLSQAACSATSSTPTDKCTRLTLSDFAASGTDAVDATATAADGKAAGELLLIFDGSQKAITPGKFDLARDGDNALETCRHCALLVPADDGAETGVERAFLASAGTLDLTMFGAPADGTSAGSLAQLRLDEVTVDEEGKTSAVKDGACYLVESATWELQSMAGAACENGDDCGGSGTLGCDPKTHTCSKTLKCDGAPDSCPSGSVCVNQGRLGACYPACKPSLRGQECGADQECLPTAKLDEGYCLATGPAASGAACKETDINSGCQAGLACLIASTQASACRPLCDPLAAEPGCPQGELCTVGGHCVASAAVSDVKVGAACTPGTQDCAVSGKTAFGVCVMSGQGFTCQQRCVQDGTAAAKDVATLGAGQPVAGLTCDAGKKCFSMPGAGPQAGAQGVCQ